MEPLHRRLFVAGPEGRLEALLWAVPPNAEPAPVLAAMVCHPNPLFGGTMHNKVVYHTAKTLHRYGLPVLRFNFRGVGLSEGTHNHGQGEQGDAAAALDFLSSEYPGLPILLAGFSFGAIVGLKVGCGDARVVEMMGLGFPLTQVKPERIAYLRECNKPKLLLSGTLDIYCPRERMQAMERELPAQVREQTRVQFVPDADHFFTGHLPELERALTEWITARHPALVAKGANED